MNEIIRDIFLVVQNVYKKIKNNNLVNEVLSEGLVSVFKKVYSIIKNNQKNKELLNWINGHSSDSKINDKTFKKIFSELDEKRKKKNISKEECDKLKSKDISFIFNDVLRKSIIYNDDLKNYLNQSETYIKLDPKDQENFTELVKIVIAEYININVESKMTEGDLFLAYLIINAFKEEFNMTKELIKDLENIAKLVAEFLSHQNGCVDYLKSNVAKKDIPFQLKECPGCGYDGSRKIEILDKGLFRCGACGKEYELLEYTDSDVCKKIEEESQKSTEVILADSNEKYNKTIKELKEIEKQCVDSKVTLEELNENISNILKDHEELKEKYNAGLKKSNKNAEDLGELIINLSNSLENYKKELENQTFNLNKQRIINEYLENKNNNKDIDISKLMEKHKADIKKDINTLIEDGANFKEIINSIKDSADESRQTYVNIYKSLDDIKSQQLKDSTKLDEMLDILKSLSFSKKAKKLHDNYISKNINTNDFINSFMELIKEIIDESKSIATINERNKYKYKYNDEIYCPYCGCKYDVSDDKDLEKDTFHCNECDQYFLNINEESLNKSDGYVLVDDIKKQNEDIVNFRSDNYINHLCDLNEIYALDINSINNNITHVKFINININKIHVITNFDECEYFCKKNLIIAFIIDNDCTSSSIEIEIDKGIEKRLKYLSFIYNKNQDIFIEIHCGKDVMIQNGSKLLHVLFRDYEK